MIKLSKVTTIITILSLAIVLFGCAADPFIGKKSSFDHYLVEDETIHQTLYRKSLVYDYDYRVDTAKGTVSFKGTINCNKDINDKNTADIIINLLFIDASRTIIDRKRLDIGSRYDDYSLCETRQFERTFPYNNEYFGIRFFYNIYTRE
jgi:hypothetical protein